MPFYLRFYAYDDCQRKTSHHLLTDLKTSSLVGFTAGKTILLIEQRVDSLAQTYVIAQEPMLRCHPRGLSESIQQVDIYVVEEAIWQEIIPAVTQPSNPWYGPSL